MNNPAAFSASVHAIRTVGSRKVVQVVLEAPIEQFPLIAGICEHDAWVGVARLQQQPIKQEAKPTNREAQRAAILCNEPRFYAFLWERHEVPQEHDLEIQSAICKDFIRDYCGVESRKELTPDNENWKKLQAEYELWLRT